jgi:tetratricopeptide (TPR) repeat protein
MPLAAIVLAAFAALPVSAGGPIALAEAEASVAAYELALQAVAGGDDAAALGHFEQALALDPDDLGKANEYRRTVIRTGEYDRALDFFEQLTADHPGSASAWLNYGYAFVDKIPASGAITQVILANQALERFSRSIEIEPSWLALYTRGNSYLYWPKIFGRAPLGVADLERAVAMARESPARKRVYVRSWIALGDGYWKTDQPEKARATWREGLELFPGEQRLVERVALADDHVDGYLFEQLDPNQRVDTDLDALLGESRPQAAQ